ncbi:bifunctional 4-hydroxy-3-methylbut-2-en-1-yl diphosphate synthase [Babesia duncani]|uniref:Bifunctional 4-hydroxy-3-methylbut-2-en-1-yl diphosphate synthase n=1 Tax=Babesia duncani TaxID=323732 RepID=A0AAD9PIG0_9APIC|nr:bifunctional 4-hydroxy-3-methylbut-2-en-1-yl diphosphate synthase [Babesia duncani]
MMMIVFLLLTLFHCCLGYRIPAVGSIQDDLKYCESVHERIRVPTRSVRIGNVQIGSKHPIALQTMTSCDTNDVEQCVDQIQRAKCYGADLVRVTVQSPREIKASAAIKDRLLTLKCDIPLVADVHFNPKVAMLAADIFDKVRVNPGNYVDGRKDFDEKVYNSKLEFMDAGKRIKEMFSPLVEKCKSLNRAIRIGTNHGSLSSRITSFYGDTPKGMVESAFEFLQVCRDLDFHNVVVSLKSSNSIVMLHAYRLLVREYYKRGYDYPIHLGVTEAGSSDEGRAKSALGIGALLLDGIGDTVRMSLTEDPWLELVPARKLVDVVAQLTSPPNIGDGIAVASTLLIPTRDIRNFEAIARRRVEFAASQMADTSTYAKAQAPLLSPHGSVGCFITRQHLADPAFLFKSLRAKVVDKVPTRVATSVDFCILESVPEFHECAAQRLVKELIEGGFCIVAPVDKLAQNPIKFAIGLVDLDKIDSLAEIQAPSNIVEETGEAVVDYCDRINQVAVRINGSESLEHLEKLVQLTDAKTRPVGSPKPVFILLNVDPKLNNYMSTVRSIISHLQQLNCTLPVIHQLDLSTIFNHEDLVIEAATTVSSHLLDKLGEGLVIKSSLPLQDSIDVTFTILQAACMRTTRTNLISCPSCGRTLFNIQQTTEEVKRRVGHLPGVTIAIMGCIVNGIGEMADADFGYVGGAPGKVGGKCTKLQLQVDFYVKKQLVERGVPHQEACDKFIELIKKHGKWVDLPQNTSA